MAALRLYQHEAYILTGELGTYPRYENHYGNDNPPKKRRYALPALKLSLKFVYRRVRRRKELVGLASDSGLELTFSVLSVGHGLSSFQRMGQISKL